MAQDGNARGTWSGQTAFILAATGSAVGLGNIWKFPYIAGENGGGAFVLIYIGFIALIGMPLLIAEMVVGRRTRKEAVGAYQTLAAESGKTGAWSVFGFMAVICAIVLLSYYSVVGGWALAYVVKAVSGTFHPGVIDQIPAMFDTLAGDSVKSVGYHAVFMAMVIGIVISGVRGGIERASKLLMPLLGGLLLILLCKSLTMDGAGPALRFMFSPDFSKLTRAGVLEALGHSFFTLSLGMGAMIAYGSYLKKSDSIFRSALLVTFFDTAVALISGVMIFGIVFSSGGAPEAGPGLVFKTMPALFAQMPGAWLFSVSFFCLLSFAALTSGISILEVAVAYFVGETKLDRKIATLALGAGIFVLGIGSAVNGSMFDWADYLVSNWALPLGGLGIALFTGWVAKTELLREEVEGDSLATVMFGFWRVATRYLAPIAIVAVILHSLGKI